MNSKVLFIMPFWCDDKCFNKVQFEETINSIYQQSDSNWHLVIIDDNSPSIEATNYISELARKSDNTITLLRSNANEGPGSARNRGIVWAKQNSYPYIAYNDSDDCSHIDRVKIIRELFSGDECISVIYSSFIVIDENSNGVLKDKLAPSIVEILDSHENCPPQGENAWIEIGTKTGYTNLTSATNVLTSVAFKFPFPCVRVSEDTHTWYRYSAGAGKFVFCGDIPSLYRIPMGSEGSSSRSREGGLEKFFEEGVINDTNGFEEAIGLAIQNGKIKASEKNKILIEFYLKLSDTLLKEKLYNLARSQLEKAFCLDITITNSFISTSNFNHLLKVLSAEPTMA
jgi:glycosyltransferase involved in cell wall biosynthesis